MILSDQHMLDAYQGTGGFASGAYLVQHTRESDEDYQRRRDVATYRNYCRKIVDNYVGTVFAQAAQRSGDADAWGTLQVDADGLGGPIEQVMRPAMVLAMLLGTVYLIVDRPAGVSRSRADDLARTPYIVLRRPGDVAALTLDARGAIMRLVCREWAGGRSYGAGITQGSYVYRGWDTQRWWVSADADGQEILATDGVPQTGEHRLGVVPAVRLHATELLDRTAERAEPWARAIVDASMDLFNRHSEARAIERDQTVSTLAVPVSDLQEADRIREHGLTIGTSNAVLYNPAGGGRPDYFAPPASPLTLLYQGIAATVADLYALANLEFVGGVQQSGAALSFHFAAANRTLATLAAQLSAAETACGRLACAWMGQDAGDLRSEYPASFETADLKARLAEDLDALSMDLGPTAERLIRGRAARRTLGDAASPADYEQIDAELAQGADPYEDRVAAAGGAEAGAAGVSGG